MVSAEYTGKRIHELRQKKGWTQKQLAEMIGVTDKAVSKWECGINYPDLTLLEPLANAFDTTVADLLGLKDSPESNEALETTTRIWLNEKENLKKEFRNKIIGNAVLVLVMFAGFIYIYWYNYNAGGFLYQITRLITILWGALIKNHVYSLSKLLKQSSPLPLLEKDRYINGFCGLPL